MGVPLESITLEGSTFRGAGGGAVSWTDLVANARTLGISLKASGKFTAPPTTVLDERGQGQPVNQYSYATHIATVQVDTITGEVGVLAVKTFTDAGRIINPVGAEGQVEGGVVMGLGYALTEAFLMEDGHLLNRGFTNYLIPTIMDVPTSIESYFVDKPVPFGELGTKGLAEVSAAPITAAIINAIYDAIGVRIRQLPATPERILEALSHAKGDER
jgi:CO/xanthine dehydrogenase Mo-binding subunit